MTPKPARRGKPRNVFIDDRGFPDPSAEYDDLIASVDGGSILRKLKHPTPPLDVVDPSFNVQFDDSIHGEYLRKNLDLSHLDPATQNALTSLIKKYWAVFDESTYFVPVKHYECVIDTGTARPIAVKKINYGPREIPKMRACIAALEKVGHVVQIHDGQWLFKCLLAPKPHQEHIYYIEEFVWRFCVNYIPLNQITRVIAYPIPRCDAAVMTACGAAGFYWLVDAPMGYHQLQVAEDSKEKLAFQGPDAIKYTYSVMPFGPVNGPATFIAFMHDLSSVWKSLAEESGLTMDDDTNSTNIVDDVFSWAQTLPHALTFIECQLRVCKAYRLSLKLGKSFFFPKRVEFVGIDVCPDGNRPAMSKFELIRSWPDPTTVRDIAKLVGFGQFYSSFIPNFELLIGPLREVMKLDYTEPITPQIWTPSVAGSWTGIKESILGDPCLARFDHRKLTVLRTDFSAAGFGYVLLQPADDPISINAMNKCMAGNGFDFLTKDSRAILRPVAFGSRRARNNESKLHSHLGEGFAGDWAVNKCRHMCLGQRFVWVTDCFAIKFILTYDGGNPAILRLQMRLMCWNMEIVHRADIYNQDADYWSRIGEDLCYDPLMRKYLELTQSIRQSNQPSSEWPIPPQNMPYYRGPRVHIPGTKKPFEPCAAEATISSAVAEVVDNAYIANVPVLHGSFPILVNSTGPPSTNNRILYNANVTELGWKLSHFAWATYGFNSGHFISTIMENSLPFTIGIACDPFPSGRSLFKSVGDCSRILTTAPELLNFVRSSDNQGHLHGYLIHSHSFPSTDATTSFWQTQTAIIAQMRLINRLCVVVAFVHPDHDGRSVAGFKQSLTRAHWLVSSTTISFASMGDSISGQSSVIIAVHGSTTPDAAPLNLRQPPTLRPRPIADFIWEPFNTPTYTVASTTSDDDNFENLTKTPPSAGVQDESDLTRVKFYLHLRGTESPSCHGAAVLDLRGCCPGRLSSPNTNLFQHFFGIEFVYDGRTCVRPISQFEVATCFRLRDSLTYQLAHPTNRIHLDAGIPAMTSASVFEQVLERLLHIREANVEFFDHSPTSSASHADAAPVTLIQSFVSGTITTRLPSRAQWRTATLDDEELTKVRQMVLSPSMITKENLRAVNYNYRHALRNSLISIEDGLLIYREPIVGGTSYTRLIIVPSSLRNIIFIAFHSNPAGGHLNVVRTLHRIRLRYFWPHMYRYIDQMCAACPGCALANRTKSKSSELLYNFPIEAPFMVMFFDAYSAGSYSGFEGSETYIIGCCGMCSFACMEPVSHASAESFASAIMKIHLRFGFCHTIVIDKDSKFLSVFRESMELLKINFHMLSGDNHNPMLVERINRYLNKGLRIMTNERGTVRVAMECILLLLYAWNSCPIPGTDISRSMVAVGREFQFPIDFCTQAHWQLTNSTPKSVISYSRELATRLSSCREVAMLLVQEHRAWHRELVNDRRPSPRQFKIGDIVFARRATRSDSRQEKVDKLMYAYTGPWKVETNLPGGSYSLVHCKHPNRKQKKHASDLSPYPLQLLPLHPVDGPDSRYSHLYREMIENPFAEAGIEGFAPPQPFQVPFTTVAGVNTFHWPLLYDYNAELLEEAGINLDPSSYDFDDDDACVLYTGPPPPPPLTAVISGPPPLATLVAAIIASSDKLFFVAYKIGSSSSYEWRLVRVALTDSMHMHPSCLQDGSFYVDFYILHPADVRFNATNQRYWLHYHTQGDSTALPAALADAHLIRPSDTSDDYARRHRLVHCRRFINLTHHDTFIHGPFDFASIKGRKSRDRVSQSDWDILSAHSSMFQNAVPSTELPSYSIHVDDCFHSTVPNVPQPPFHVTPGSPIVGL